MGNGLRGPAGNGAQEHRLAGHGAQEHRLPGIGAQEHRLAGTGAQGHRLPGTGAQQHRLPETVRGWIDRAVRLFYVHPRRVGRRSQLCLRAPDGSELGWKDVGSGRVMVRDQANGGSLARAILEAAGPAQLPLAPDNLPGIALDVPGGAVLAQLRLRSAAILVGKELEEGGDHHLYATFARPGRETIGLGYVDLRSGARYPSPESAARLEPETAAQLLHTVVDCRPREHFP